MTLDDAISIAAHCGASRVDVHALLEGKPEQWWADFMWGNGFTVEVGPFECWQDLAVGIVETAQEG